MDLRDQLSRLGLQKGTAGLRPRRRRDRLEIHDLVEGEEIHTPYGPFFLAHAHYPLDFQHGIERLQEALAVNQTGLREFLGPGLGEGFDLRQAIFIDTETTGLAGGTGTYAFLVGIGYFDQSGFRVLQFYMRDYDEERALLHHLAALLGNASGLVSFNGRAFDIPLLQTRLITARFEPLLSKIPHLDLLPPSRKLWRPRVGSCRLGSLEEQLLGVHRSSADVPGWLIPSLYFRYLQSRDAREIVPVLYHNTQDVLSMVTLASILCRTLIRPEDQNLNHLDSYSLGRWCEEQGKWQEAEALYRQALAGPLPLEERRKTLLLLSFLLKRQNRRAEAADLWKRFISDPKAGLIALEELAKWEEWHTGSLAAAAQWTEQALKWTRQSLRGYRRNRAEAELQHRLGRLQRKMETRRR